MLKALFVLQIFKVLSWLSGHVGKRLGKKAKVTPKFMATHIGKQIMTIHILSYIARNKGNQTMKFGQLIEYNMRNNFLQNLCWKWGRETSSRPLYVL